ncbi:MAG: ABC transporter permease [Clostridium sp.]
MLHRFLHNKTAVGTVSLVLIVALMGIFAPVIAPHDPYATDILNKFAHFSKEYPLGTDNLGRCILSRMVYGIRPTLGLAVLTMLGTIGLGALMGLLAGYFRGITEELIMRVVDVMLSFPSQIMVFAVVALLGINVQNVIPGERLHQMGLVCPHDPHRRHAVPRSGTLSSFPAVLALRSVSSSSVTWFLPLRQTWPCSLPWM